MTTPKWVLEQIQKAKEKNLTTLEILGLGVNQEKLSEFPLELLELKQLTKLYLNYTGFTSLPESLAELQNLETLGLSNNRLTTLPEPIIKLQNLKSLDLSGNQFTSLPYSITKLRNLQKLDLRANKLNSLPEFITELQNLISLSLHRTQLSNLPDFISNLQNLTRLNLGNNQLTSLPELIGKLQNLTSLNLIFNQLIALPGSITNLQNLQSLSLSGNQFATFPETITELQNLQNLEISRNQLTNLPSSIAKLQTLKTLLLDHNQLISLPEAITKLQNLKTLDLFSNKLETPPQEVAVKGIKAIREYFRQLKEQGQDKLYEAKLLVLGEGGAGKTTFANKIKNPNYQLKEEESTKGLDVIKWSFPVEENKDFKVNIWDFGGQEVYHATHQFFLTRRSLYALVADTRREDTDFYYWLSVAELLSDGSPLLIIKNEKQDHKKELNERQLKGQFNNIKDVLDVNLSTNSGLDRVRAEVEHYLKSLPHIGSPLPKTWVRVREALEGDKRNYISLEEYFSLCKQNGFADTKDNLQLSSYLNDIGVFLHFQDEPLLKKTIILKPKWGTDAVYKVLDHPTVVANKGRFSRADVESIWEEPEYENMRDELLQLMMKFKLCYEIPNQKGTYIAPQLLSENHFDYEWDEKENLQLRYTYEFMPKGILLQFIVAMSESIWNQSVWKSGVVLGRGSTRAEVVEYYGRRQIHVRIQGAHKKELMTIVIHELDKIHNAYKRLKYDKLIPCNCAECKNNPEPHFYLHEQLLNFTEKRIEEIQCGKSGNMTHVRRLVDDIIGYKSEKEVEALMAEAEQKRKQQSQPSINVGSINISGNANVEGFNLGGVIQNSFNKANAANINDELKETLKKLAEAVNEMNKELPPETAKEAENYLEKLVDETTKEQPKAEWYSVSIDGLLKAAANIGKVGDAVIQLVGKVKTILTGGIL